MDNNDNKILQEESDDDYEFKYNFVSIPWDDRTTKSKVGIVSLLVTIFAVIVACVAHNLITHFGTLCPGKSTRSSEVKCHFVRVDEYRFVARIHLVSTQQLLCVGAVISLTTVIANGVCVKAGAIRLRLGSPSDPRCKKGFAVDVIEPIYHEGTVSKHLVLLISYKSIRECSKIIDIGTNLNWKAPVYIIGRPLRGERTLSRQAAKLTHIERVKNIVIKNVNILDTICVKDLARCPVRAGDLLVQNRQVFGLASTSTHVDEKSTLACFADLGIIQQELTTTLIF